VSNIKGINILPADVMVLDVINYSDLTLTISSSVAQWSLIFDTPAVLAGKNPMWGKMCCYELTSNAELFDVIDKGLKFGFSVDMNRSFLEYVARELKYHLFVPETDYDFFSNGPSEFVDRFLLNAENM
jgi:hypothetical protein